MARTKKQLSEEERQRIYDSIQNDGRSELPSSNVQSYKLEFKLSFSGSKETFTATFDLSYDTFLDTYLVRKTLLDTLSVCLKEQGFSFNPKTLSVECVKNKEQFRNTIIPILNKGTDEIIDKGSNESTLLECTKWSAKDDTTLTCNMFKDSYA
jgi:hypothetical protein